jgi:hypothetical protein
VQALLIKEMYQGDVENVLEYITMHFRTDDPLAQLFGMRVCGYVGKMMEIGKYSGNVPRIIEIFLPQINILVEKLNKVRQLNWKIFKDLYAKISEDLVKTLDVQPENPIESRQSMEIKPTEFKPDATPNGNAVTKAEPVSKHLLLRRKIKRRN